MGNDCDRLHRWRQLARSSRRVEKMIDSGPVLVLVLLSALVAWCLRSAAPKPYKRKTAAKPPESTAAKKARETIEAQAEADTEAILGDLKTKNALQRLADRANRRRGK